jgi:hypothetical protein
MISDSNSIILVEENSSIAFDSLCLRLLRDHTGVRLYALFRVRYQSSWHHMGRGQRTTQFFAECVTPVLEELCVFVHVQLGNFLCNFLQERYQSQMEKAWL